MEGKKMTPERKHPRSKIKNQRDPNSKIRNPKYEIVVVGASLGGLRAIKEVFKILPKDFPLPVAIVQHREKGSDDTLMILLQESIAIPVIEVEDKQAIQANHLYLAPPHYHLLIEKGHFALSTEEQVCYARPSIDVLFESAADAYQGRVIGVILTGANEDGARGLSAIKKRGGLAIVQDPKTAEAPAMPEAAIAATAVDRILSPEEIGGVLWEMVKYPGS